MQTPTVKCPY